MAGFGICFFSWQPLLQFFIIKAAEEKFEVSIEIKKSLFADKLEEDFDSVPLSSGGRSMSMYIL